MNYEDRYNEALKIARDNYNAADSANINVNSFKNTLTSIFPELKESEDELTWLKNYISEEAYYLSMDIRDDVDRVKLKKLQRSLAWLEKQGESKPIERKEFTSIPFGAFDSELIEETITIPDGCCAVIEDNKIHIKKEGKTALKAIKDIIVDNTTKN